LLAGSPGVSSFLAALLGIDGRVRRGEELFHRLPAVSAAFARSAKDDPLAVVEQPNDRRHYLEHADRLARSRRVLITAPIAVTERFFVPRIGWNQKSGGREG
jgi:hypothetical protein